MKYDITIIRVGVSEAMALKALDIYGVTGYDIKICGYTTELERKEDKLWKL